MSRTNQRRTSYFVATVSAVRCPVVRPLLPTLYALLCVGVDGIYGSGKNGPVKNGGVEKAGVDISARYGKGGQCGRNNTVTKAAYKISSLEVENDSLYIVRFNTSIG